MFPGYSCFANYGGYGWIGALISLAVVLIVVVLIIWVARRCIPVNRGQLATPQSNPREILQIRYARGELSREEYQQIKADLN